MDSSAKRKVGAIALIVAGIGAFLVPFLLHGPALQASANNGGNTNGNNHNNNNGGTTTTAPASTCTTNCSTDTTPPTTCSSDPTSADHSSHDNEGKHLAKGHDKQDKPDTSLVGKAQGFMAALGKHNPQHDATHSTKTDNDTTNANGHNSNGHDTDDTSACADDKDTDTSDDQGNDD